MLLESKVTPLCWLPAINYPLVHPHGDMMVGMAAMVRLGEGDK
jgi:hypothetical protein